MNRAVITPVIASAVTLVFLWNGNFPSACHRNFLNQDTCRSGAVASVCFPSTLRLHTAMLQEVEGCHGRLYVKVRCLHGKPITHVMERRSDKDCGGKACHVCVCVCVCVHAFSVGTDTGQ